MLNEQVLEERLAALEAARSWSPRVVSRLETLLRSPAEEAVYRVNPMQFAADKGIDEAEAIDLFLHATRAGLFEMDWLLVCRKCSDVVENFRSLLALESHFHCTLCHSDCVAALDDDIMVTFTVSPSVRRLRFHDPDTLSAWEYAIYYRGSPVGRMDDGTPWLEMIKSSLRAITWLTPGTKQELAIDVGENLLIGFDMLTDANFAFVASGAPASAPQHVPLVVRAGTCEPAEGTLAPGRAVFEVQSRSDRRSLFGILAFPLDLPKNVTLHFVSFLSGARLLASQTFRDFFRSEVIRATEGIAVRNVTLLFTDLKGSTALYERIGDLNAYMMVQRHFDHLQAVTARHQGAVTKTIGDAVMAAFLSPAKAVEAAIEMREAVEQLNRDRPQRDFVLKIGMHNGAAIAVTLNDRLDYFGQTVNIAARVQALADGDEIWMTQQVHDAPGVAAILAPLAVEPSAAELKGVEGAVAVYRVRAAEEAPRPA